MTDAASPTCDPEVVEFVSDCHIENVLHFTTNRGLLGVLASRYLKSRTLLAADEYLENIVTMNARYRTDTEWLDRVNLSITRINTDFFRASGNWHRDDDLWWCVISLRPEVLAHPGVYFSTTNNIYPATRRGTGIKGLSALFASTVPARYSAPQRRTADTPASWTTCVQAEALYPREVPSSFIQRIYVTDDRQAAVVESQIGAVDHPDIEIVVDPLLLARGWPT